MLLGGVNVEQMNGERRAKSASPDNDNIKGPTGLCLVNRVAQITTKDILGECRGLGSDRHTTPLPLDTATEKILREMLW
jgi:hypothetical protein